MLSKVSSIVIAMNSIQLAIKFLVQGIAENKFIETFSIITNKQPVQKKTQMKTAIDKMIIKVAIHNGNAYWVHNNVIYQADIDDSGKIRNDEAIPVDVFSLSEKEVSKLLEIIDTINK